MEKPQKSKIEKSPEAGFEMPQSPEARKAVAEVTAVVSGNNPDLFGSFTVGEDGDIAVSEQPSKEVVAMAMGKRQARMAA